MNIQGKKQDLKLYNEDGVCIYKYIQHSDTYWSKWTYNDNGQKTSWENSNGDKETYTQDIPEYTMEELVDKIGNFKLIKK